MLTRPICTTYLTPETKTIKLLYGEICLIIRLAVSTQFKALSGGQTDKENSHNTAHVSIATHANAAAIHRQAIDCLEIDVV